MPRSRRPDTKVIALIDYEALKRGSAEADETCEIAGVGPVPVATVRAMLADAFGAAIVPNGVDVFTVRQPRSLRQRPPAHRARSPGYRCEIPGCDANVGLEIDHIEDWAFTHQTSLNLLAWHCRPHHLDKTYRGWRLTGPPGDRQWIAPADARGQPGGTSPPDDDGPTTLFGDPPAA